MQSVLNEPDRRIEGPEIPKDERRTSNVERRASGYSCPLYECRSCGQEYPCEQRPGRDKPERCVKCQSFSISLVSYARMVQLAAGGVMPKCGPRPHPEAKRII